MSMYELVFGSQGGGRAAVMLTLMGVEPHHRSRFLGRFRDAWVEKAPGSDGPPHLVFYTRNGGGNREDQDYAIQQMRAHPWYVSDADDTFDNTYASFHFQPSAERPIWIEDETATTDEWRGVLAQLTKVAVEPVDTDARWQEAIDQIREG